MKKSQADTLALIFARDIIKTSANPNSTVKLLTESNAVAIGNFRFDHLNLGLFDHQWIYQAKTGQVLELALQSKQR